MQRSDQKSISLCQAPLTGALDLCWLWRSTVLAACCTIAPLLFSPSVTAQISTPQQPFDAAAVNSSQVVVLSTGGILEGKVSFGTGVIIVETDSGSRPVVPQHRVEFICNSMPEAYWEKLARIKASDTAGQIALFDFCLKYKLLDEAENQINLLSSMQNKLKAESIAKMQRRLLTLLEQEAARMRIAQGEMIAQTPRGSDTLNPVQRTSNASLRPDLQSNHWAQAIDDDGNVIEVARTTDIGAAPAPMDRSHLVDAISDSSAMQDSQVQGVSYSAPLVLQTTDKQMLEELRKLPSGTVASFKRTVEPILVAGCVKCHDKSSGNRFNGFPLIRIEGKGTPDRYTQRNLFAILGLIERNGAPESSYLWTLVTTPHASMENPVFAIESEEAATLLAWLGTLAQRSEGSDSIANPDSLANADEDEQTKAEFVSPIEAVPDLATMPRSIRSTNNGLSTVGEIPSLNSIGMRAKGYVQVDPFDPEIFNRKIADQKKQSKPRSNENR